MATIPTQNGIQGATAIFNLLTVNRSAERYKAIELLNDPGYPVDNPTLKILLMKAINEDYYVGKEAEQNDRTVATIRSWMLGALAQISTGDDKATDLVLQHIDGKFETYAWARYWSLKGLIAGKNSQVAAIAKRVKDDDELLVGMLATAYLASQKDEDAMDVILNNLDDPDKKWAVLRALRFIPLPKTVDALCEMVESAAYADQTYDAIVALYNIPRTWNQLPRAAQALSSCIMKTRESPWNDSIRNGAIIGLGILKVESTAPLLIEELTDYNPAIVREAARAMEKILGLRLTVARVVESASRIDAAGTDIYASALRWLNREAVVNELETLMSTGPEQQQNIARSLMSELGGVAAFEKLRARTDAMKQYTDVLEKTEEKIRELFDASVREAQSGFKIAVIMDLIVFIIGILLLSASATYALRINHGDLSQWAGVGISGGLGVLGIIYGVLIANPRRQVRESVNHLMLVKIIFLSYLRRLHQADQAYTRRMLDDDPVTVEQVKLFADLIGGIMEDTVQQQLKGASPAAGTPQPAG